MLALDEWPAFLDLPLAPGDDAAGPEPHELAAIVYASGTTGQPKGVMLTRANVLPNVDAVM